VQTIAEMELHQSTTVRGPIVALGTKRFAGGRKSVVEVIVDDGTARLHCRWWNLPYMQNYFRQGDELLVFGRATGLKPRTMDHPETEVIESGVDSSIHLNRIAPVYPLTEGLPQRWLRSLVWRVLQDFATSIPELWPADFIAEFPNRRQAINALHFPEEMRDTDQARQRLALDELIELQVAIRNRRKALLAHAQSRPCPGTNQMIRPFLGRLGFRLTDGQTKVLREIRADMSRGQPMRRLLQGEVGSGKTLVAACSALLCLESGFSAALMAPTEILAQQHFRNFKRWFDPLGAPVHLQTASRKTLGDGPSPPAPAILIGTHALIQPGFVIENLGLVIIDEQHRFGVAQREAMVQKGQYPHLLVMTATPIPRTLGLTVYGDLDISTIRESPGGRTPIKTFVRTRQSLPKVWEFVRSKLAEGRQAFAVYPRIEDNAQGIRAVTQEFEALQKELAPFKAGLLHGRLTAAEREATMTAFEAGQVHVLLSTSLVEVGVDVSNATVMLIQDAEQFGLAQLHQLRGRIGRGAHKSYCILVAHARTADALQRLKIIAETADGFRIAEADLKLRGPGDLLGQEQSGTPPFRFADLAQDLELIERARALAAKI
jgi:ATP-dependent DNA helicase RecG